LVDYCPARSAPGFQLQPDRYVFYAIASGVDPETVAIARKSVEADSSVVVPERNEQPLAEAPFKDCEVFYAGTAWRGWVAYA
jgi:tRNA (cmo5U34)-methyltransferase